MFEERRHHQINPKGIDKSYPLEPLTSSGAHRSSTFRKPAPSTAICSRSTQARAATNGSTRPPVAQQQRQQQQQQLTVKGRAAANQGCCAETAVSIGQNGTITTRCCGGDGDADGSTHQRPANGCATRNGGGRRHYEINIDDVIDNEAMQRNRMVAKFHPLEIERRRRFSDDIESEEIPEEMLHDVPDVAPEKHGGATFPGSTRRSCHAEAEQFHNANTKKGSSAYPPATTATAIKKRHQDPSVPRQSSFMKTTKSASLKVRKLPRGAKPGEERSTKCSVHRKCSLTKKKPKKEKAAEVAEDPPRCHGHLLEECDALKSIPLICEIIRSHSHSSQQAADQTDGLGKVNAMVIEIEKRTTDERIRSVESLPRSGPGPETTEEQTGSSPGAAEHRSTGDLTSPAAKKRPSMYDLQYRRSSVAETSKVFSRADGGEQQQQLARSSDGLDGASRARAASVEHPTERQELTVADHSIGREAAEGAARRARRASFETKRLMFERVEAREEFARRDSVESALRCFESIGAEPAEGHRRDSLVVRVVEDGVPGEPALRGFERPTQSWAMKASRTEEGEGQPRRRLGPAAGAKLAEARDSVELARARPTAEGDEVVVEPVESQSFPPSGEGRVEGDAAAVTRERVAKDEQFSPSATRIGPGDYGTRRAAELGARKAACPTYPSSKSPEVPAAEPKRRPAAPAKPSTSLKIHGQETESNGDVKSIGNEIDSSTTDRKHSLPTTETPITTTFSSHKSFTEEKTGIGMAPAARTASSLSSSSSVETSRSHGSTGSRANARGRPSIGSVKIPAPPKPAASDENLTTCKICNRRFTAERIGLHEQICSRTAQKKRKQFDAVTHRIKGTELESFQPQKPLKKQSKSAKTEPEQQRSNWRRKHEDFINAIRSAKQMQAHLAAGGKLSDLPPPPPTDTSDYIQCPHCSRKFNRGAAERHIPKCETMQHNKPKPRGGGGAGAGAGMRMPATRTKR